MNQNAPDLFHKSQEDTKVNLRDIVLAIFSVENHQLKTKLKTSQVVPLTRLMLFADRYDSKVCKSLEAYLTSYMVSVDGLGRTDLREALKSFLQGQISEDVIAKNQSRSLFARLLGRNS